jgi:hypothetical protein
MGMEKYTPNRARFFVRKKYTTFSTGLIVALRSVNIFPESYDFAAKQIIRNNLVWGSLHVIFRETDWYILKNQ